MIWTADIRPFSAAPIAIDPIHRQMMPNHKALPIPEWSTGTSRVFTHTNTVNVGGITPVFTHQPLCGLFRRRKMTLTWRWVTIAALAVLVTLSLAGCQGLFPFDLFTVE